MKKKLRNLTIAGAVIFSAFIFSGCGTSYYSTAVPQDYDYSSYNPQWAPQYNSGVRYYYFPDIECYYDLSSRYFVFLNNGQWVFVESLSSYYPMFDLSNSFVVVINVNVYRPWMHHQYYNSHYPRYYYRDYYDYSNIPYVRGFNENQRSAIFWDEKDYHKARNWDDRNLRENRRFSYSENDRRVQDETTRRTNQERNWNSNTNNNKNYNNKNNNNSGHNNNYNNNNDNNRNNTHINTNNDRTYDRNRENNVNNSLPTRTSTTRTDDNNTTNRDSNVERRSNTNYYGQPIGRPVKVERQMRDTETQRTSTRSTNTSTDRTNNSNTNSRSNNTSSSRSRQ